MMRAGKAGGAATTPPLGLPTRPMNPEEQQLLLRRLKSPGAGVLRMLGILTGLGAVMLSVTYYLGTPYDPDIFPFEVMIVGVLAIGFGAGASSMVRDPRAALEKGEVLDVTAPVAAGTGSIGGLSAYQMGPINLQVPAKAGTSVVPGQTQQLSLALGLRPAQRNMPGVFTHRALLLSVNGIAQSSPPEVRLEPNAFGAPLGASVPYMAPYSTGAPGVMPGTASAAPAVPPAGGAFCDQCGQLNASNFKFCSRCGAPRPAR